MNHKDIKELEEYAALDGTEWGDMIIALCSLAQCSSMLSDKLREAVTIEIKEELANVKENAVVTVVTETVTRTHKELEWND